MAREWWDSRDRKQWKVDAVGIPRRVTFRCIQTLEAYTLVTANTTPVSRYPEAELQVLLDAARSSTK